MSDLRYIHPGCAVNMPAEWHGRSKLAIMHLLADDVGLAAAAKDVLEDVLNALT